MGNIVIKAPKLHIKAKQISNVYFAKEVKDNNKNISFEKIKEGRVDSKMYIVIETENLEKGDVIKVRILQYVAIDEIVNISEQDSQELTITVGNYEGKGGTATQAITPISLGVNKKDNKEFPHFILHKEKTLYVAISVTALKDGKVNKEMCYNLKEFKHNYVDAPNIWYGNKNNAFYLERRKPIIVIDPGHGYTKGNTGTACRIYKHKIRDTAGNPKKDSRGNFVYKDSDIIELPQYVINDYEKWVVSEIEDSNRNERGLVFDVAVKISKILKDKGYKCYLTRVESTIKGIDNQETRAKRIKIANDNQADYFISIHSDGGTFNSFGSHTIYPKTLDKDIKNKSKKLAEDIYKYYDVIEKEINSPKEDTRGLQVLSPSNKTKRKVLVELGFLTNPREAKSLFSNIDKIADQLAKGLIYNIENSYSNDTMD
jgi:N-acetylmuramoyl-L-alanine amidase